MMKILGTFVLLAVLFACSKTVSEENFIGNWQQVNGSDAARLSARISKEGAGFSVEMTVTLQGQPAIKTNQKGKFTDGMLQVDGLENVRFVAESGRILIGVNEYERVK